MKRWALWLLGAVAVVLGFLVAGLRRVVRVVPTGEPTPEQARIEAKSQAAQSAIDEAAEAEKRKVNDASGQDLADQFSDRMLK